MKVPAHRRIRGESVPCDSEQPIGPARGDLRRGAELPPVVGERLDVRDFAHSRLRRRRGDQHREVRDRVVHRRADRAGRSIDVRERGRGAFEKEHRALGGDERLLLCDLLDLRHRLTHARNRRLRLPAEGVTSEATAEGPRVAQRMRRGPQGDSDLVGSPSASGAPRNSIVDVVRRARFSLAFPPSCHRTEHPYREGSRSSIRRERRAPRVLIEAKGCPRPRRCPGQARVRPSQARLAEKAPPPWEPQLVRASLRREP